MTQPSIVGQLPSRRLIAFALARVLFAVVVVLAVYAVLPASSNGEATNFVLVLLGGLVFLAVLYWQVREVARSAHPVLRATEALGICVSLFLVLFSSQYLAESLASTASFSEPLEKFSSLYFTVTVFSTVGFGDIVPVSNLARGLAMCQMIGNLIVLGVGVRVLTGVARGRLEAQRQSAALSPPDAADA